MNTLPEECLLSLLSFVSLDPPSLHSLLLVNRTFFRLVVPILYRNPLSYRELKLSKQQKSFPPTRILHLLLTCAPDTLKQMPIYTSNHTFDMSNPFVDYLSYYTFHSEKLLHNIDFQSLGRFPTPERPHLPESNQDPDLVPIADLDLLHITSNNQNDSIKTISKNHSNTLSNYQLKNKIHLGLVGHSPQNITVLAFSIHNIRIIHHLVPQLSSLARLELTKDSTKSDLNNALQFISTHRSHFSTLKEIKISATDKSDLSSIISAMGNPHVIDVCAWPQGNEHLSSFPLQECRVLLMPLRVFPPLNLDPDFLTKLSNLHTLRINAFHQDMFASSPHPQSTKNPIFKPLDSSLQQMSTRQLQLSNHGMTSITLNGPDEKMVPALTDICESSRSTLKILSGTSIFTEFIGSPAPSLSWTWLMPSLTNLDLEGTVAVNFNLDSLEHCPLLHELHLNIGRKIPQAWDVFSKAAQLAKVSNRLRILDLAGWWGFPDSELSETLFPVLLHLKILKIMFCTGPTCNGIMEILPRLPSLEWLEVDVSRVEYQEISSLKESLGLLVDIDTLFSTK